MGTGYALFTQDLSIQSTARNVSYAASDDLFFTYNKTVFGQGGDWLYSIDPATIENNGSSSVQSWQLQVTLPSGTTNLVCDASVSCNLSGTALSITPLPALATINASSQITFAFSFEAPGADYSLEDIILGSQAPATFQQITGLSTTSSRGTRTKGGTGFHWPFTFTITNNSGQSLNAWRVSIDWTTANFIQSMPTNVNYTTSSNQLIITSTQPLSNGNSFQFTPELGTSQGGNWDITGMVTEGLQ